MHQRSYKQLTARDLSTRAFTPGVGWSAPVTVVDPAVANPKFSRMLQTDTKRQLWVTSCP